MRSGILYFSDDVFRSAHARVEGHALRVVNAGPLARKLHRTAHSSSLTAQSYPALFFFIRAPMRSSFRTVPVGKPFI